MCGRFAIIDEVSKIAELFSIDDILAGYHSSYNIPPGVNVPAIVKNEGRRSLATFRWGLIPSWAKDPKIGYRMINARSETIQEKASFRGPFKTRRCIIPASGFFEWEKKEGKKEPVYIYMSDREPFGLAGIYEKWISPAGEEIYSCSIITVGANELIMPIHDRMPVIIEKNSADLWLSTESSIERDVAPLMKPFPPERMAFHHVSRAVNSPKNNSPECIEPVG